jgi:hypothetical protein
MSADEGIAHPDSRAKNAAAFFQMSRSSRRRAFSRRQRVSSSGLWVRPLLLGNAALPCVSTSSCHLSRWLRRRPHSRATAAARRPDDSQSRTASRLNSFVKGCSFVFGHLPDPIVPFLKCPRKWNKISLSFSVPPDPFEATAALGSKMK